MARCFTDEAGGYLAREQRLTLYDAAYVELAMREGLPIATLDQELKRAAEAVGVRVL